MKVKNDLVLDFIYSVFIAIILVVEPEINALSEPLMLEIFRAIGICAIVYLWIRVLSKNFKYKILHKERKSVTPLILEAFRILYDLSKNKLAVLIIVYALMNFSKMDFSVLLIRMLELYLSVLYVFTIYLATYKFAKNRNYEWLLAGLMISPFILFFVANGFFQLPVAVQMVLIPANAFLIYSSTSLELFDFALLISSLSVLTGAFLMYLKQIKTLPDEVSLPLNRMN